MKTAILIIVMTVIVVVAMSSYTNRPPSSPRATPVEQPPSVDDSPAAASQPAVDPKEVAELQAKRKKFVAELIVKGVIQKVEMPATLPHLWVRPAFYLLDFQTKQTFASVVYAYYATDDPKTLVVIYDSQSGKKVGRFSKDTGLAMD